MNQITAELYAGMEIPHLSGQEEHGGGIQAYGAEPKTRSPGRRP